MQLLGVALDTLVSIVHHINATLLAVQRALRGAGTATHKVGIVYRRSHFLSGKTDQKHASVK